MLNESGRRPLKTRASKRYQEVAQWLSNKNITPNFISILSIIFAALSAVCFLKIPYATGIEKWLLPAVSAVCIQLRLLCNLLDGLVAIEGKKGTKSGELYNDIPDLLLTYLLLSLLDMP